jgi:AraC family transcriptional activator of tynA and feaB
VSPSPKESERVLRVSTDDVPPDRRQAYWQEAVARLYLTVDLDPDRSVDFAASLTAVALDNVNLVQLRTTAMAGSRPGRAKDSKGEERCLFVIGQGGEVELTQEDRRVAVGPGGMALIDSRLPCAFSVATHASILALSLPREALTERIGAIDGIAAAQLADGGPLCRFALGYLEQLSALAPEIDRPDLFRLKNHVLDMLAIAIGRRLGQSTVGSAYKRALLHRMKEFIEERLQEPQLSIGILAERFRVTPRYVSALFSEDGTTFNGFTRQRRLARCRNLLELSRGNAPSIGEIAIIAGFGSQAYLNKAFKKAFGMTPGDYRRGFQRRAED